MAQLAYNSGKNTRIRMTTFYVNYGYELTMSHETLVPKQTAQEIVKMVEKLKNLHEQLARNIKFILVQIVKHYNNSCSEAPSLKKEDRVYLL